MPTELSGQGQVEEFVNQDPPGSLWLTWTRCFSCLSPKLPFPKEETRTFGGPKNESLSKLDPLKILIIINHIWYKHITCICLCQSWYRKKLLGILLETPVVFSLDIFIHWASPTKVTVCFQINMQKALIYIKSQGRTGTTSFARNPLLIQIKIASKVAPFQTPYGLDPLKKNTLSYWVEAWRWRRITCKIWKV